MTANVRLESKRFSLKRTLVLVAAIEAVLAVALFVYYQEFQGDFFPYNVNDDGSVTVEGQALLIGYGEEMSPPWTFTAVGTDTLRLNGLPFLPMRSADDTIDLGPGERDRLLTIKAILNEAQDAYDNGEGKEDGMVLFANVLVSYLGMFVESVSMHEETDQITVDFVDDLPAFTVTFLREPHWIEPEGVRRKKHMDMIEEFIVWMGGNDDGAVFSFGPYHTELLVGDETRQAYDTVLTRLDELASTPRGLPSEMDVRREFGDDEFVEWEGLIRDYLSWRGMHQVQ